MANEFERHLGNRNEGDETKASEMHPEAAGQASEAVRSARDMVHDSPGTVSTGALIIGMVGFALGYLFGQASRSGRY